MVPQGRRCQVSPAITNETSIEALRESAEQLRLFVEQAPVGIAMFDRDMRYLATSQRWRSSYGLGEESLVGRSHYDVFPDIPGSWKENHQRALAGESLREEQDPFPRADGRLQWRRWEMRPWRGANGTIGGILIFSEDVTARVEMERALRDSRKDLDRAQAVARIGSWRLDVNRNKLTWSAETFHIFGVSPEAPLRFESFLALVHPDDRDYVDRSWKSALSGAPYDIEHRIIVDNKTKWVRERAELELDTAGKLIGGFGTVQDITDKKQAEEKLRHSEARYRMLHENLRDAFVQVSMDGRIIECNNLYCEMLGYSPEEVRELTYQQLTPERWRAFEEGIVQDQIIARGYSDVYEKEYLRKDGAIIPVELRTMLSRNASGRPETMWAIVRDIRERKRAEGALRESEEKERQRRQELETTLAVIPVAVYIAEDKACTRITANLAGYRLLRISEERNASKSAPEDERPSNFETYSATGEILAADQLPMQRAAATGEGIEDFELELRFTDGQHKHLLGNALPLFDAPGEVRGAVGAFLDITERKQQEEHNKLLMAEVNHRSKNLLAVVQAVAQQTARAGDPATFVERLSERIEGLAASQDLLVKNAWQGVEMAELIEAQLAHFEDLIGTRVLIDGPAARLTPAAGQAIGMALHELATNAVKYGALSNREGRVHISWQVTTAQNPAFLMSWLEEGGPKVTPPSHKGFGQMVIGQMLEVAVDGTVEFDYRESGLSWKLNAPAAEILEGGRVASSGSDAS